jgi:glutamine phosphoribosylpyrophosphate amidotransferase
MCGVFGFDGSTAPDADRLRVVASAAARRGPHACGVSWVENGALRLDRKIGPWAANGAALLAQCAGAHRMVGHFRLATTGDWRNVANNQPLVCGAVAVAHNGNIPGWQAIAARLGIQLRTSCDSELVAHALERHFDAASLASVTVSALPHAILAVRADAFLATRRGLPLFKWVTPEGIYYSSVQPHADAVLV